MTQIGSGAGATRTVACTAAMPTRAIAPGGWVVDLPDPGERVNVEMKLVLGTLVVGSNVPQTSACSSGGYSWFNYFDFATGLAVTTTPDARVSEYDTSALIVGFDVIRLPSGDFKAIVAFVRRCDPAEGSADQEVRPAGQAHQLARDCAVAVAPLALAAAGSRTLPPRLAVAVLLAVGVHGAAMWRLVAPAHVERGSAAAPVLTVRQLSVPEVVAWQTVERRAAQEERATTRPLVDRASDEAGHSAAAGDVLSAAVSKSPESRRAHTSASTKAMMNGAYVDMLRQPTPAAPQAGPTTPRPVRDAPPSLPPAPDYLAAGRLDPGPIPLEEIEPAYPEAAGLTRGIVVLRLLINERGQVDDVAVVRAAPRGLFEGSALAAFGDAKFSPGMMLGVPVKSQVTIEVEFTPINRGATVSGSSY